MARISKFLFGGCECCNPSWTYVQEIFQKEVDAINGLFAGENIKLYPPRLTGPWKFYYTLRDDGFVSYDFADAYVETATLQAGRLEFTSDIEPNPVRIDVPGWTPTIALSYFNLLPNQEGGTPDGPVPGFEGQQFAFLHDGETKIVTVPDVASGIRFRMRIVNGNTLRTGMRWTVRVRRVTEPLTSP